MKTIYLSGKITDKTKIHELINIYKAWKVAKDIAKQGIAVICPHTNGYGFKLSHKDYLKMDVELLRRCDELWVMDNWHDSKGCKMEIDFADKQKMVIKYL